VARFTGETVRQKTTELIQRSLHVGTNVTIYTGPELGRIALLTGQRNIYGGYNWDTRVRSRSAKYTVCVGSDNVAIPNPNKEQEQTLQEMDLQLTRLFGGKHKGKEYQGHTNMIPTDLVHRVMGSGEDIEFTFNCYLMVSTKSRANHHVCHMWGMMLRQTDPVPEADDIHLLMVPDVVTGDFGRFYCFPENNVTVGLGSDYMGEAKKGFLRMAMFRAKQRGILGVHAGAKIIVAHSVRRGKLRRYGVVILGLSGTGKTTNIGHTHYLDHPDEQSLVVQDDFVGLRMKDGRVLGTEQAMFLKTDLDEDDILLRPATQSADFVSQNLYVNYKGEMEYLEEDLCANGRGILPLRALPQERRYHSIDLPALEELDTLFIIFNTRRNTVVPILQELTAEQAAAYFMLGESIETAAGDPTKAGQSIRVVGTNPFIVGSPDEEGNMFHEYVQRYRDKVRCFVMNTGGVGELRDPTDRTVILQEAKRPWKTGIGYVTRSIFRETAVWHDDPDFGTRVLVDGVYDEKGDIFDMSHFSPRDNYDNATREEMVRALNRERVEYLHKFPKLDKKIVEAVECTHLL
jgi:phosphoenolpyruvate carboxykinase (ATP)